MSEQPVDGWVPEDTFGGRLAQIRAAKGWNVARAAKESGISPAAWTNYERGSRRPQDMQSVAAKVSDATGADYVWLMVGESAHPRRGDRNPGFSQAA